jgi:hypothetical protein
MSLYIDENSRERSPRVRLFCAGRVVNIEGLGSREGLEEAVKKVQSSCLAGMFQVSMDRRRYAAVGAQDMDKGEEVALEEIRALEEEPPVSAAFSFLTVTIPHSILQCDCHYH